MTLSTDITRVNLSTREHSLSKNMMIKLIKIIFETPLYIALTNAAFEDIFVDSEAHFSMSLWSASASNTTGIF